MMKYFVVALFAMMLLPTTVPTSADAGWRKNKSKYSSRAAKRRTKRAQVRGFTARRGGYSYNSNDVVNTDGDSRTRYGGVNAYRDPFSDRQTNSGPFDHGWFFDSAVAPRGGDSPYMQ